MPFFKDPEICRNILETLQFGVCVVDRQRRVVLWNDGAERITGYLRHEVVGHQCESNILLHCNQRSCELCGDHCPHAEALHNAKAVEVVGALHHKTGHRTPVHSWIIPVRDEHGSIIAMAHTFDAERAVPSPDRRDTNLAAYGCLDVLTGAANHAMMQSHLRECLGTFGELHIPFCIICAQLENLDHLISTYGREAVTLLLRVLAKTLENTLRPKDFVGRWSEDQFLGILIGCCEEAMVSVCERVRRMMTSGGIQWWGKEVSLHVSIGFASAKSGDTIESLIQRAQECLKSSASPAHVRAAAAGPGATAPKR